jgi:hypothetical protein
VATKSSRWRLGQPIPQCLYCGREWTPGVVKKSDEHPLGQWMKDHEDNHPPEHKNVQLGLVYDERTNEFIEVPADTVFKKKPLLSLKTRSVCKDCNEGPLSSIQEAAKPVILGLQSAAKGGFAVALGRDDARRLAVWAQTVALTDELTSDGPRVGTVSMGRRLCEPNPLAASQVWLARHPRDYDLAVALAQMEISDTPIPRPGPPDRQVLLASIVYHHLSILVFITDSPGQQAGPKPALGQWVMSWPMLGHATVEYPPATPVRGSELTEIFANPSRWIPPIQVAGIRRASG